jgi:CBS domain-containing protein
MTAKNAQSVAASIALLEDTPVENVMTRGVVSCPLETPLETVAEMMASHRVHCIVGFGDVTEDDTAIWGVVSDLDLIEVCAHDGLEGRTAGGAASSEVVTITPGESLRKAAQLMSAHGVAHLLVVEERADRPIGIISTLDVARTLASRLW